MVALWEKLYDNDDKDDLKCSHVKQVTFWFLNICFSYEFVKYLRQYINSTLGSVIEEETEKCTSAQNQGEGTGYDTLVQHVTKKTRESKEWVVVKQCI